MGLPCLVCLDFEDWGCMGSIFGAAAAKHSPKGSKKQPSMLGLGVVRALGTALVS